MSDCFLYSRASSSAMRRLAAGFVRGEKGDVGVGLGLLSSSVGGEWVWCGWVPLAEKEGKEKKEEESTEEDEDDAPDSASGGYRYSYSLSVASFSPISLLIVSAPNIPDLAKSRIPPSSAGMMIVLNGILSALQLFARGRERT